MRIKDVLFVSFAVLYLMSGVALAQVMVTADPSGAGKSTVAVSLPYQADDFYGLHAPQVSLSQGLSNWLDVSVVAGANFYGGHKQAWVGAGGNLRVLRVGKNSVSLFGVVTTPVHRREKSSATMLSSAVIVSREFLPTLTVYVAPNWLKTLSGQRVEGFTLTQKRFDVPIGASVGWDDGTRLVAELDFASMKAFSMSIRKTF